MTERQKQTAWIVTGVVVGAAIISNDGNTYVTNEGCSPRGKSNNCGEGQ